MDGTKTTNNWSWSKFDSSSPKTRPNTYPSELTFTSQSTRSRNTPGQHLPPLQLSRPTSSAERPLVLRKDRELSPVNEEQDKNILGRLDGLIGLDQVVRGAHFAVHSCATYPFTILRRQFQVFPYYNLTFGNSMPWHTLAVMHNTTLSQGMYSWWRSWQAHSVYLIGRPMVGAIVSRLIEPKRTSGHSQWLKRKITHFVVDGLTYAVCMPFVSFILMESVQHFVKHTYTSDYAGFKEFIRERPLLYSDPSNRLSYAQLIAPTLATSIVNDLLLAGVSPLIKRILSSERTSTSLPSDIVKKLSLSVLSSFLVDLLLYPLLTVTIRLHCQGLPILVQNMETGSGVQFVRTFYSGPLDCVVGIWEAEGVVGFYKGLSALLLQYSVQGMLLLLLWRGVAYWEKFRKNETNKL